MKNDILATQALFVMEFSPCTVKITKYTIIFELFSNFILTRKAAFRISIKVLLNVNLNRNISLVQLKCLKSNILEYDYTVHKSKITMEPRRHCVIIRSDTIFFLKTSAFYNPQIRNVYVFLPYVRFSCEQVTYCQQTVSN